MVAKHWTRCWRHNGRLWSMSSKQAVTQELCDGLQGASWALQGTQVEIAHLDSVADGLFLNNRAILGQVSGEKIRVCLK